MTEQTFEKLLVLMRAVPDGGFWLSCLHEPTLHPKLERFIALIPPEHRKKAWFTTNLAKPLQEAQFEAWAQSGLHHINISFDTLNPELFALIRKFGRYEIFEKNLNTLARVFRSYPDAPRLRYITMALKCNLEEIPRIIERTHVDWRSSENEIRYTYNCEHFTDEFRKEYFLTRQDWDRLSALLRPVHYHHTVAYPEMDDYFERIVPSANFFQLGKLGRDGQPKEPPRLPRPLRLRFRPDGTLAVVGMESAFQCNINDLPDPCAFFRNAIE
jgi:hypothetical protein